MSTQALAVVPRNAALVPLTVEEASHRYNSLIEFTKTVMVKDQDFGVIDGVSKPCLYKAGAEKLCTFFGMVPMFSLIERVEDWTGKDHGGEMFFYFFYKCVLVRGDAAVGEGDGSCNSFEKKYRWRSGKRKCPQCGLETIIVGKPEYGGGFLCYAKKGGCGAKFRDKDPAIVNQDTGTVPNPDIAEQVNTIQKMAQKRALVAATLIACNASAFYTMDMEDMRTIDVDWEEVPHQTTPVKSHYGDSGSAEQAAEAAKAKLESLGGDPAVVEMPKPRAARAKKSTVDKPKGWGADKAKQFQMFKDFCNTIKSNLKRFTGTDAAYYSILKDEGCKHCTDAKDDEHGKRLMNRLSAASRALKTAAINRSEAVDIREKIGSMAYSQILDKFPETRCVTCDGTGESPEQGADLNEIDPCGVCLGIGNTIDHVSGDALYRVLAALREALPKPASATITDEDVPAIIGAKPVPAHHKLLYSLNEEIVRTHMAGGKFKEFLGSAGAEAIEHVTSMQQAQSIERDVRQWMADNPREKPSFGMTLR